MASKQMEPAVIYPPPAGCAIHERADWLPDLPLPWLQEVRGRHIELAQSWARAMNDVDAVRAEAADREAEYRRVGAERDRDWGGDPAAGWRARPGALGGSLRDRGRGRRRDPRGPQRARSWLPGGAAGHTARTFDRICRGCRRALLQAVSTGSRDQRGIVAERLRRQIAELEAEPAIENLDDTADEDTPDLKETANA